MAAKVKFQYNEIPTQVSQEPITTGTSVVGLVFDDGVIIAADQLVSYGSMARFRNVKRVASVNDRTIIGCGGDYADYQHVLQFIQQKVIDESTYEDGHQISPQALYTWLTRVQYNRRSNFDPLWCSWVIGGIDDENEPFLGMVDKLGTAYRSPHIATGFGNYLAIPMLRSEYEARNGKISETEALQIIHKCMQVLYYRDARSWNKYHIAIVNKNKPSRVEGPLEFIGEWDFAHMVTGYE